MHHIDEGKEPHSVSGSASSEESHLKETQNNLTYGALPPSSKVTPLSMETENDTAVSMDTFGSTGKLTGKKISFLKVLVPKSLIRGVGKVLNWAKANKSFS